MRTQRQTDMTELMVVYRNFAKSDHYLKGTSAMITHVPAESTRLFRSALFWVFTKRIVVIPHRRLEITYRSHLEVLTLENGIDRLHRNFGNELSLYDK
jgi:hypothetical protein